jgi:RNA polymerase sigma-70 factor (ECF subfamily)
LPKEVPDEGLLQTNGQWQASFDVPLPDFDDFYRRNHRWLYARAYKMLRLDPTNSIVSADDIVQDTFILAFRQWDRIGRLSHPKAYLARVAERIFWNAREKALRSDRTFLPRLLAPVALARDPHEQVADADVIERMLARLPARQAEVLVLNSYAFSDSEIGQILDLAPATVRSHLRHARNRMANLVAENGDDQLNV